MSWEGWGKTHPGVELLAAVSSARAQVTTHPLYASLNTRAAIITFMEHHVFAVWDFMSLLKSLQRNLTCVTVPWVPTGPTDSRRLINDIVLAEESDELRGGHISHFEWYVAGMAEAGADHSVIDRFIDLIRAEEPVPCALEAAGVPRAAAEFVTATWGLIGSGPVHCQAAAFAFGREDLIPDMFTKVVAVNQQKGGLETFVDYLERHIEVDGEAHTPMAMQMLADLCGQDEVKWRESTDTACAALAARSRRIAKLVDGSELGRPQARMEHHIVDGRTMTSLSRRSAPLDELARPGIREAQCLFIGDFNWRSQAWARDCDPRESRLGSDRYGGQ